MSPSRNGDVSRIMASPDAEEALLGSLLIDAEEAYALIPKIEERYFYRVQNGQLFRAMKYLYDSQMPIDLVTLTEAIGRVVEPALDLGPNHDWSPYIIGLLNCVPTSINAKAYLSIVKETFDRRRLIQFCGSAANRAYDMETPLISGLGETISEFSGVLLDAVQESRIKTAKQLVNSLLDGAPGEEPPVICRTGLEEVNDIIGGISTRDFMFIGGRPGDGKSALSWGMATHIAQTHPVVFYSFEMQQLQLLARAVAAYVKQGARETHQLLVRGDTESFPDWLLRGLDWFSSLKLTLDCSRPTAGNIFAHCAASKHKLFYVFVDNINNVPPMRPQPSRLREINETLSILNTIPQDLNIGVVCSAQISRKVDGRKEKNLTLEDFKETGEIEERATVVMAIERDKAALPGRVSIARLPVLKNRDGLTGVAEARWVPGWVSFRDVIRVV